MTKEAKTEGKPQEDLTAKREAKCIPIAKQILALIAAETAGKIGSIEDNHTMKMSWVEVTKKMLELYLAADLTLNEVGYVHQLVMQAVQFAQNLAVESLNDTLTRLQKQLFDGKTLEELSLKEIDMLFAPKRLGSEAQIV